VPSRKPPPPVEEVAEALDEAATRPLAVPVVGPSVIVDEVVDALKDKTDTSPVWDERRNSPIPDSGPVPAISLEGEPTRAIELKVTDRTEVQLAQVASFDELRKVVTRPSASPGARRVPPKVLKALAAIGTLSLVLLVWLYGRTDPVKDPSRPVPLSRTTQVKPTAPAPIAPPERTYDATALIAPPTAPARAPLTMQVTVDAGAGLTETRAVPASVVRIETDPPCTISYQGEDYGPQPVLITMPVGANVITIENPEVGLKRQVTIKASDEERTFLRLEFVRGWVDVDAPASAKVSIDGVPAKGRTIAIWEGRHRVEVVFANGQKDSKSADVVRGETTQLFFDAPAPNE
jgi:hypothetical protein